MIMTRTKNVQARGLGSLSIMPGGGLRLNGGKASAPASVAGRNVELELSRMDLLFILSQLAEKPHLWEDTLRGIVAAYDEMDAAAAEQAAHPGVAMSPVHRVARNWRDQDQSFGPLYYKIKAVLYGTPAAEKTP